QLEDSPDAGHFDAAGAVGDPVLGHGHHSSGPLRSIDCSSPTLSSANLISRIVSGRLWASNSRQRWIRSPSSFGAPALISQTGLTCRAHNTGSMSISASGTVEGSLRNVASRYMVAPKLKMSVRSLMSLRFTVSGAMYSGVPCTRLLSSPLIQAR